MNLSPIVKEVALNGLLIAKMRAQPRTKLGLALYGFSGIFAVTAIPFMAYSFYLWAGQETSALNAALYTMLALLGLALIFFGVGCILTSRFKKRYARHLHDDVTGVIQSLIAAVEEELHIPVREHPKTSLALAGLFGLIAGKYIR